MCAGAGLDSGGGVPGLAAEASEGAALGRHLPDGRSARLPAHALLPPHPNCTPGLTLTSQSNFVQPDAPCDRHLCHVECRSLCHSECTVSVLAGKIHANETVLVSKFAELQWGWGCLQDMFAASLETPQSSNPRRGRKWYFERLEVQTIKCNVTLIPRPGSRDVESGLSPGRIRMAATLGVNFIDINNVPLKINALAFQNALLSPSILMSHITRHLINSVSTAAKSVLTKENLHRTLYALLCCLFA